MSQHPNARLTPRGRALICERVGGGMRVSDAAAMAGVSRQTAHKWLARARGPVTRVRYERERPGELSTST